MNDHTPVISCFPLTFDEGDQAAIEIQQVVQAAILDRADAVGVPLNVNMDGLDDLARGHVTALAGTPYEESYKLASDLMKLRSTLAFTDNRWESGVLSQLLWWALSYEDGEAMPLSVFMDTMGWSADWFAQWETDHGQIERRGDGYIAMYPAIQLVAQHREQSVLKAGPDHILVAPAT